MSVMNKGHIEFLSSPSDFCMADEWYQFVTCDHFWMKWRFECMRRLLSKDYVWGDVLDIGCGNGIVREQIKKYYNCRIAGCDLNLLALQMASLEPGPLFFYNIQERREELKEKFNTILLLDVLEHLKEPIAFLCSVGFHLEKRGRLIINVPAFKLFYSKYDSAQGHVKRYTLPLLKKELHLSGFLIENTAYWGATLIPLLLVRRFVMSLCRKDRVMERGFYPSSSTFEFILQLLRRIECAIFATPPVGTSLLVIARKGKM